MAPINAMADDRPLSLVDPEDGKFDLSSYLVEHKGALPVPFIITEPAVGYGKTDLISAAVIVEWLVSVVMCMPKR